MASNLPPTFRKLVVQKISSNFREATEVITAPMIQPGPNDVVVKNRFVGINASDINYTSARYNPSVKPPFDCGFEGIGEVVAAGTDCKNVKIGQAVGYVGDGAFAEYTLIASKVLIPLPSVKAEFLPLLISGMTAEISLDKLGDLKKGENVLVTAAAGGTGQFAVQLAKNAGCHVIGLCSTDDKVEFLKKLGCDRPINYKKENLKEVLMAEYKQGVDVVYETIGAEIFDILVERLAVKGRLIVIGYISGYESKEGYKPIKDSTLPKTLLKQSSSVRGFLLPHFVEDYPSSLGKLTSLMMKGSLQSITDNGANSPKGPFKGVESIWDGVDYLYSRKNMGKIVVEFPEAASKP